MPAPKHDSYMWPFPSTFQRWWWWIVSAYARIHVLSPVSLLYSLASTLMPTPLLQQWRIPWCPQHKGMLSCPKPAHARSVSTWRTRQFEGRVRSLQQTYSSKLQGLCVFALVWCHAFCARMRKHCRWKLCDCALHFPMSRRGVALNDHHAQHFAGVESAGSASAPITSCRRAQQTRWAAPSLSRCIVKYQYPFLPCLRVVFSLNFSFALSLWLQPMTTFVQCTVCNNR